MVAPALVGVGASLLGGLFQGSAAKKAAAAQTKAAEQQMGFAREVYDDQTNFLAPYRNTGNVANAAYAYELGLGSRPMIGGQPLGIETIPGRTTTSSAGGRLVDPLSGGLGGLNMLLGGGMQPRRVGGTTTTSPTTYRTSDGRTFASLEEAQAWANANPTGGTGYQKYQRGEFETDPGYNFRQSEAIDAVQSSAAARGLLGSGATVNAINDRVQNVASDEYSKWWARDYGAYQDYLNRLSGVASNGQNAAGATAAAAGNYGGMGTNALAGIGNSRSTGIMGQGNAINDAITNALSAWQYGRAQ